MLIITSFYSIYLAIRKQFRIEKTCFDQNSTYQSRMIRCQQRDVS